EVATFPPAARRGPMARTALTISADGTQAIYAGGAGRWVVHDAATGRHCELGTDVDGIGACCWSADKRFLALALVGPSQSAWGELWWQLREPLWSVHVF